MRPDHISIEGFGTFAHPTEIDFAGVDLFGFTGPTGSGKSTLIDAMVFALYGSVPRYDNNNLVAPAISQGSTEAKVQLTFSVGPDTYTAVRIVRRTKTGASTREARLERDGETVAGDVRELDAAVETLLGLDLDQFTTCVVLPQGQFATLLHATSKERQELLVRLLDLGRYKQMAGRARSIDKDASTRHDEIERQLAELVDATDDAVTATEAEVATRQAVATQVAALVPELAAGEAALAEQRQRLEAQRSASAGLAAIDRAHDVEHLTEAVAAARAASVDAASVAESAAARVVELESELEASGDSSRLKEIVAAHGRFSDLAERVAKGSGMVAEARERLAAATASSDAAAADLAAKSTAHEAAVRAHALAAAAGHLAVGDDCPLCGNVIDELTPHDDRALVDATEQRDSAQRAKADADRHLAACRRAVDSLAAKLDEREADLASVEATLDGAPPAHEVSAQLARVEEIATSLVDARVADRTARAAAADAAKRADAAADQQAGARRSFGETRDAASRHAADDPPPTPGGDDLVADWDALLEWRDARLEAIATSIAEGEANVAQQVAVMTDGNARLVEQFTSIGESSPVVDLAVGRAHEILAASQQRLARLTERVERRRHLTTERDRHAETAAVHSMLATLLGTNGFEKWLLAEALHVLVEGASVWLGELSSGAYALTIDEDGRDFFVIDRRQADQRRLAKTLSGGETFLASLALALALAERVSDLAAEGAPRLESIFLDEGFGTLDPQTLDVVASAIEELGATGRMVGVISHVPELAERLPTVFEVTKGADTSSVVRVDR